MIYYFNNTILNNIILEHQQPSKSLGVLEHISNCQTYKFRQKQFMEEFKNLPLPLKLTNLQKEMNFTNHIIL